MSPYTLISRHQTWSDNQSQMFKSNTYMQIKKINRLAGTSFCQIMYVEYDAMKIVLLRVRKRLSVLLPESFGVLIKKKSRFHVSYHVLVPRYLPTIYETIINLCWIGRYLNNCNSISSKWLSYSIWTFDIAHTMI